MISLDRRRNRTHHYWHAFVAGVEPGQVYGYRAQGAYDPLSGRRFDAAKLLLDPYGRGVATPRSYSREAAKQPGDTIACAMKSVVVDPSLYDWEGDAPLRRPSIAPSSMRCTSAALPSTPTPACRPAAAPMPGLVEKIGYLVDLGVSAVELLPVFAFDAQDAPAGLVNYWGYSPVSFFAPHTVYSSRSGVQGAIDEFRDMVKALHRAGIEVILDVVYNHTAEGDHTGPTICFRGLDNEVYYTLDPDHEGDRARYANYSGTGNTLNANQSTVRRMIIDSLHYWVQEMHVDGFRFDLASILSRDERGRPLSNPPVLWDIENDPILAGTKLIAEAWDAAGLYQVGSFIGDRWKEWNGHFRDDVRRFVKSDANMVQALAPRLFGSPDLYGLKEQEPDRSINFVTCHDGFTLNDLVSYNEKHNWANGEQNRDGNNVNYSWNCGLEGPTKDLARDATVERLRRRQIKNFLAFTLLSLGVPMLLMGDEMRRTQGGNNNAYCQDNKISWLDWSLLEEHAGIHLFVRRLIRFRLELYIFKEIHGLSLTELLRLARIEWHGTRLNTPDNGADSRTLALLVAGTREAIYVICNAYWEPLDFELPPAPFGVAGWRRIVDTSLESPDDFCELASAPLVVGPAYHAESRSCVLLAAEIPYLPRE